MLETCKEVMKIGKKLVVPDRCRKQETFVDKVYVWCDNGKDIERDEYLW